MMKECAIAVMTAGKSDAVNRAAVVPNTQNPVGLCTKTSKSSSPQRLQNGLARGAFGNICHVNHARQGWIVEQNLNRRGRRLGKVGMMNVNRAGQYQQEKHADDYQTTFERLSHAWCSVG